MTKIDLIKKILELGKELENKKGFDAAMVINDMEIEVDNYTKQLHIHDVMKCEQCHCQLVTHSKFSLICEKCEKTYSISDL